MSEIKQDILMLFKDAFPFSKELNKEQLSKLHNASRIYDVNEGEHIIENEQECPGLALILKGKVKVSRMSSDGREVTLYRLGRGQTCVLSAICILGAGFGNYYVEVTAEQRSKIMMISTSFVRKAGIECEPLWRFIFVSMADSLYQTMDVIEKVAFQPLWRRLIQYLIESSAHGKHAVYITHDMLSRELGTAREVVSRQLKGFEKQGIISIGRGKIDILKVDELINMLNKTI
jgi:CRP/FNR family transcriptional regulator